MNATLLAAILGTGGFASILGAIIAGISSRRKLGAEATEIITNAAAGVVKNMQGEIDRQVKMNASLVAKQDEEREDWREQMHTLVASHEKEMDEVRRVLQLHVAWDAIAIAKMSDLGVTLPPAPPLLPPIPTQHPEFE